MRKSGSVRVVALTAISLVIGSVVVPHAAAQSQDCPTIMPVSEVRRGMMGVGHTVESGRTITQFDVEILGVIPDATGPGRPMIVVNVSGPPIDRAGGIWFGMSGSPVYIDGRLVGAVAFGLSAGPSSIGGLQPAELMNEVLSYPTPSNPPAYRDRVRIPQRMRHEVAARAGVSENQASGMRTLRLPVGFSGLSSHALDHAARVIDRENLPLIPYAGGAAGLAPSQATPTTLEPGSSFAAALSYGDVTAAGVGTTTFTCSGRAMAFGHPMMFFGASTYGANAADAIVIVDDPLFGPYKQATIAETVGVVDQDRGAGIRATFGAAPVTTPIRSTVSSTGTGRIRQGGTDVVFDDAIPFIGFLHMLSNIDVTIDRIGEGNANLSYTISGTRADGSPWSVTRTNQHSSPFDISIESLFELQSDLFSLMENPFEEVEITGVQATAAVEDVHKVYEIEDTLVRVGGGSFEDRRRVSADPGDRIDLQVVLSDGEGGERTVSLSVRVPRRTKGDAFIEISSGRSFGGGECFVESGECFPGISGKVESFDDMLAALTERPRNNELLAKLFTRGSKPKSQDAELLDRVVEGFDFIQVRLGGPNVCCAEGGRRRKGRG